MSVLIAKDINKSFQRGDNTRTVLNHAELQINAGELVTILGPSGSGKSTLLNVCGLIDTPDRGELIWQGKDLLTLDPRERTDFRRENMGFIFQSFNLIPVMTVRDNVAFPLMLLNRPASEIRTRVDVVLSQVGLKDYQNSKPGELSGGQCQRVAIARALVKNPKLIIADEPTASLDSDTAMQVMTLMKRLMAEHDTACLVATHDARLLQFSDRILRIDHGDVVAHSGSARTLRERVVL